MNLRVQLLISISLVLLPVTLPMDLAVRADHGATDMLLPKACFTGSKYDAIKRERIDFDASCSNGTIPLVYQWRFGDGTQGLGVNVSHAWSDGDVYTVRLTVRDSTGDDTATRQVNITNRPPVASFNYSPAAPVAGQVVNFLDSSSDPDGDGLKHAWDFGDGGSSTEPNPTHTYASARPARVCLTVTDDDRRTPKAGMDCKDLTVGPGNQPPRAGFSFDPANPKTSDCVAFRDTSQDPDGSIVSRAWDFGNGNISADRNPECQRYPKKGTVQVSLRVMDDKGANDTNVQTLEVLNTPPVAAFDIVPASPTTDDLVRYVDRTRDFDGKVIAWAWEFGDGTQSSDATPNHKYEKPGSYAVRLTVVDSDGSNSTATKAVEVRAGHSDSAFDPIRLGMAGIAVVGLFIGLLAVLMVRRRRTARAGRRRQRPASALARPTPPTEPLPAAQPPVTVRPQTPQDKHLASPGVTNELVTFHQLEEFTIAARERMEPAPPEPGEARACTLCGSMADAGQECVVCGEPLR